MRGLIDSFPDALALTDENGMIVLASQRLGAMFGYERGELTGLPVEKLIPAAVRAVHRRHRTGYAEMPRIRLKEDRARLAGLRKDGATIRVEISLTPVPAAGGQYTLAVVRKAPATRRDEYLPRFASAGTAGEAHQCRELELLGRIVNNLLFAALNLRGGGIGMGDQVPVDRVAEALQWIDDTIRPGARTRSQRPSRHAGPAERFTAYEPLGLIVVGRPRSGTALFRGSDTRQHGNTAKSFTLPARKPGHRRNGGTGVRSAVKPPVPLFMPVWPRIRDEWLWAASYGQATMNLGACRLEQMEVL